ncbi:MAG: tRNA (guanosine(46)-N7)-methyltransferase TrmB [SAR324 cluster bacterium]|nr:tRNA (guanosine(46)-N7)-methyltransferase TrmB [SAR324 cluster bacterium]
MARIYDYPELLIPHPSPENFQQLWDSKKGNISAASGKVHLEIGSGSGRYLIEWAQANSQDFFIGLELRYKRLVLAAKKMEQQNIHNILLMRERGEFLHEYLPNDSMDCMHINFPDPWSKKSRRKHRILSADFLTKVYPYFSSGGELRFKTDHLEYFETVTDIIQNLETYKIVEYSKDLHRSEYNEHNILTEFEMLFKSKGNPSIGYLLAETL